MRADLHIHSYYSDGLQSPEDIVKSARANGVELIAVTDHDCMLAHREISALCKDRGIKSVSGIEVSAYSGNVKVHTLGYNADGENPVFKQFAKRLYDGSFVRAEEIICKLNKNGVRISMDEVLKEQAVRDIPVHTMHIARAAAKKGYANTPFNFYLEYLVAGKPAFSNACRPAPGEAIEIIKACGGISSLAHPGRIDLNKADLASLIKSLAARGLDGIEAVYSTHTAIETAYYKETANALNLLVTGGSDTHINSVKRKIGTPVFYADKALAERLHI